MNIDNLLYESENDALDFKSEQYKFISATDDEKSELLKDILAFSNSWKRASGYILVGVKEQKGEMAKIVGIDQSLDDASIQQFINLKVNKPITFSYKEVVINGKRIGIFEIPVQSRPFFLLKDYGKLESNIVYIRRGSSTAIANPEEIARMGTASLEEDQTKFEVTLFDKITEKSLGEEIDFEGTNYTIIGEESIPDYPNVINGFTTGLVATSNILNGNNKDYYRDYAKYYKMKDNIIPICLRLTNNNSKTIYGINGKSYIPSGLYYFIDRKPAIPKKKNPLFDGGPAFPVNRIKPRFAFYTSIDRIHHRYELNWWASDIFPGESIILGEIFIVFNESKDLTFAFEIVGENIPIPVNKVIKVKANIKIKEINASEIIRIAEK